MKPIALPTFELLNQALSKTTAKMHPSEVHGLICGLRCGSLEDDLTWQAAVTGDNEIDPKVKKLLQNLYSESAKQLADFLFEFQLVLPEDKNPLPLRAEALSLWCQGFLTGLKRQQVPLTARETGEVTEGINDLIEIAKMDYEEVVDSEEDESAYTELVEYVRMAIILIYQELREPGSSEKIKSNQVH